MGGLELADNLIGIRPEHVVDDEWGHVGRDVGQPPFEAGDVGTNRSFAYRRRHPARDLTRDVERWR
jgi:hypothetical protein